MYARPNIKQSTSMNHKHFTTSGRESALERLSICEIYRKLARYNPASEKKLNVILFTPDNNKEFSVF